MYKKPALEKRLVSETAAIRMLGVTAKEIRKLQRAGTLKPVIVEGAVMFDVCQVAACAFASRT